MGGSHPPEESYMSATGYVRRERGIFVHGNLVSSHSPYMYGHQGTSYGISGRVRCGSKLQNSTRPGSSFSTLDQGVSIREQNES